jgi:hypothetical protein
MNALQLLKAFNLALAASLMCIENCRALWGSRLILEYLAMNRTLPVFNDTVGMAMLCMHNHDVVHMYRLHL